VADRFAVGESTTRTAQGAWFVVDRTELTAVGTRIVGGESLGWLLQEGGEGSLGQSAGRGRGDLFEGSQVDVEAGASVAEGAAGHHGTPWAAPSRTFWSSWGVRLEVAIGYPALKLRRATGTASPWRSIAKWSVRQSRSWPRQPASVEAAADFLYNAHLPLVYGLSNITCEAQRESVALAELIGGVIDSHTSL
jgi:hypothetical protein